MYTTFAKVDALGRVTDIRSSFFGGTDSMTAIGQDETAYISHQYVPKGLLEEHGLPRYKLVDGEVTERTQAEIDADIAAIPAPPPSSTALLQAQIDEILIALLTEV